jgi:hypothetical protein
MGVRPTSDNEVVMGSADTPATLANPTRPRPAAADRRRGNRGAHSDVTGTDLVSRPRVREVF